MSIARVPEWLKVDTLDCCPALQWYIPVRVTDLNRSPMQISNVYNSTMTKFQKIPWPRIFAEGSAIIISILLAFWIQAWWEGRQQRADERIFLQSLLDDLRDKQQQLQRDKLYIASIFDSVTTLFAPGDPAAVFEFPEIKVSNIRDHTDLLSRDDFQGILIVKIDGQVDILRFIRTQHLEEQLDEIIAMLEDELANNAASL